MVSNDAATARSVLFTPATRPERFEKAAQSGADIVALDLEDSVAATDKLVARNNAIAWLAGSNPSSAARAVRINNTGTIDGLRDLMALAEGSAQPDIIILPKVEAAAAVEQLAGLFEGRKSPIGFIALIESATALRLIADIARSSMRLDALMLGSADLSADLRCANSWESLLHARSRLVAAAAETGIGVIDAPCFDLSSVEALEEEIRRARQLGFTGKSCIHPRQVTPVNDGFLPSADEIRQARAVLAETDGGIGVVGGRMVDEAMARRARQVLATAETHADRRAGDGGAGES